MSNKPFEIQSPSLSLNGVNIDTSAQGKLVIPGVTRAGTSVAIEVEDTGDQTATWGSNADPTTITIIDGYQFAVLNGDVQAQVGWTAATYAADNIDGEGYIDGITVTDGGANYTGEAVTFSQQMLATLTVDPINNFNPGDWNWIPFKVRCGAGDIESEFGGGSGAGVIERSVNYPYGESGDTKGTIALATDGFGGTYICTADYTFGENQDEFTVLNTTANIGQPSAPSGYVPVTIDLREYGDLADFLANPPYLYDSLAELSFDGGDTWVTAHSYSGNSWTADPPYMFYSFNGTEPADGAEFLVRFTEIQLPIWKQLDNFNMTMLPWGISNKSNDLDLYTDGDNTDYYAEVWMQENQEVLITADGERTNWHFQAGGNLVFPDGSIQTTAYAGSGAGNGTGWGLQYGNNTTDNPETNSGQTFNSVTVDTDGSTYYFGGSVYEVTENFVPLIVKISSTGTVLWSTTLTDFPGTAVGGQIVNTGSPYLNVFVEDETDPMTTNLVALSMDLFDGTLFGTELWAPLNNDGIGIDVQKTWKFDYDGATLGVGFSGFTTGENRVITLTGIINPGFGSFTIPKANVPGLDTDNYSFCYIDSTISIYSITEQGANWYIDTDDMTDYTTGTHTIQIPEQSNAFVGSFSLGGGGVVTVGKPGHSYERYRSTAFDPINGSVYAVGDSNGDSILSRFNAGDMSVVWHKNINDNLQQLYLTDVVVDSNGNAYVVGDDDGGGGYVTKVLPDGTIAWRQHINDNGAPFGLGSLNIAINANDEIVVAAGYYSSEVSQLGDIWIAKFDTEGAVIWQRSIGTNKQEYKGSAYSFNDCQGFITADDTSFYLALTTLYGPGPANASAIKLPLDGSDVGVWGSGDNMWTYREETWPIDTITITTGSIAITDLVVEDFPFETSNPVINTDSTIFPVQTTQFGAVAVDRIIAGDQTLRLNLDGSVVFPDDTIQYTAYPGSAPVSPHRTDYNSDGFSWSTSASIYFETGPYTVIVVTSSVETGVGGSISGPESKVTEVSGLDLTWYKRSAYSDPTSNVHQRSEVWYAVNNSSEAVGGYVGVYFDNWFDNASITITGWTNCNLDNPWTVSGPTFSNSLNSQNQITGQLSIHESFTTGIALFAVPNSGSGYAIDWNNITRDRNSGGFFNQYAYLSSKEFSTPQYNLRVTSNGGPDLEQINAAGVTAIFDALVGAGGGLNKIQKGSSTVTIENDGRLILADGKSYLGRVNDDDVVLWTDETAEYVGLWYGGDRDVNSNDYGPEASFSIGQEPNDDMYFGPGSGGTINREWDHGYQANIDLQRFNWHFDGATGDLTLPQEQIGGSINIKGNGYSNTWFNSAVTGRNNRTFAVGGEQSTNQYFIAAYDNVTGMVWRKNFDNLDLNDGAGSNLPTAINIQYSSDVEQVFIGYNEGNSTGVFSVDEYNGNFQDHWAVASPSDNSGTVSQNAFTLDASNNPIIVGHTSGGQIEHLNVPGTRGVDLGSNSYVEVSRSLIGNLLDTVYWNTGQFGIQNSSGSWIEPNSVDKYWNVPAYPLSGTGGVKTALKGTDYTLYGASGGPGYIEIYASYWPGEPTKLNAFLAQVGATFTALTGSINGVPEGVTPTVSTFSGSGSWYEVDANIWHMDGNWTVVSGDPTTWAISADILSLSYGSWLTVNVSTRTQLNGGIYYDSVDMNTQGTEYQNGDQVRIKGSQLGGADSTRVELVYLLNFVDNKFYFDKGTYPDSFTQADDFVRFADTNARGIVTSVVELTDKWEVTINTTHGVSSNTGPGAPIIFSDGNDVYAVVNPQGNSVASWLGVPAASTYRFVLSGDIQGNIVTRLAGTNYAQGDYRIFSDGTTSYLALTSDSVDPLDLKHTLLSGVDSTTVNTNALGNQSALIAGAYNAITGTSYYGWPLDTNIGGAGIDDDVNALTVIDSTYNIRRSESSQALVWTTNWSKTFGGGGANSEYFNDVAYDSVTNTIYAVGDFRDTVTNVSALVMALDNSTGDVKWQKFVGTTTDGGYGYGASIKADGKGGVIIIGENDAGYAMVTKLKAGNGDLAWQRIDSSHSSWNQSPEGVIDYNGDVYVGGTHYNGNFDQDVFVLTKLSGIDGNEMWVRTVREINGDGMDSMWDTFCQSMTFTNGLINWGGNVYNYINGEWEGIAISLPMDGSRTGTYGDRFEYLTFGYSSYQESSNTSIVVDPTTLFTATNGLDLTNSGPNIDFSTNDDSYYERYDLTTGLPGIVFGDGSEIAHPGIGRSYVDHGNNTYWLQSDMNGSFMLFDSNPGNYNSYIYIPPSYSSSIPIGFTVTVVIGDFNSATIYVNNNGNGDVRILAAGSSNFSNGAWTFGGDSKAGIYTIMKVDTDTWMLAGPNIQVD